jgi:transposase InsO family protein
VHAQLRAAGHRVARKRVARLMRHDGLRARPRRRYVVTTQSRHAHPVARNLVKRKFEVAAPNRVWVSDLTYLRTVTGFVYLAVVLDLFSRRVVGWKVSRDADAGLAVEALRRALAVRSPVLATLRIRAEPRRERDFAAGSTGYLGHAPRRRCARRSSPESGPGSWLAWSGCGRSWRRAGRRAGSQRLPWTSRGPDAS